MKKIISPISVYCTAKLRPGEDGSAACAACARRIENVEDLSPSELKERASKDPKFCGLVRGSVVLASAFAISSCASKVEPPLLGIIAPPGEAHCGGSNEESEPSQKSPGILLGRMLTPEKTDQSAIRYPTAEWIPAMPGFVKNPYTGKPVDVSGIPLGSKVREPGPNSDTSQIFHLPKENL